MAVEVTGRKKIVEGVGGGFGILDQVLSSILFGYLFQPSPL